MFFSDISDYKLNSSDIDSILCKDRKDFIETISNDKRKKQSLLVWKLLEFATNNAYPNYQIKFYNDNGKWVDVEGKVYFSLSHSNNIVAVGISDNPIGVDVEAVSEKILKIKSKFNPADDVANLLEYLTVEWTKKESLYKAGESGNFKTTPIFDNANKYFLTACSKENDFEFVKIDIKNLVI